jgi:hypothetical protein
MWRVAALVTMTVVQAPAPDEQVVIRGRLSPTNAVRSVTGNCASNRYRIELHHNGERNALAVQVNGRAVPQNEIAKVTGYLPSNYFMFEPDIAECFWDRPNARMRVVVAQFRSPKAEGLSFEVSPEGKITNIRRD